MNQPIEIYRGADGQAQVEVRFEQETVWLSQAQMVELFGRDVSVISRHIRNAITEGEIDEKSNLQKMQIASADRPVTFYDLETIISVGYRIKSPQGVAFRRWATTRLKEYLLQGYTLDRKRLAQNAAELEQALALIQKTAASPELTLDSGRGLVDIVSRYTHTFLWLQQYDEGLLGEPPGENGGTLPTLDQARAALASLKQQLIARGEATALFAQERGDGLAALLGNLDQTVFGEPAYPSIESLGCFSRIAATCASADSGGLRRCSSSQWRKPLLRFAPRIPSRSAAHTSRWIRKKHPAAHLLYFVVKNHPFADGNKRSGAFLFVDFLHRNQRLLNKQGQPVINDTGLAALTLLVAESDPKQKDVLIRLVMHMLHKAA